MKILFLTPQVPYPPRQGAALRNWGLISGLAARHELAVLSFLSPGRSSEQDSHLQGARPLQAACRIKTVPAPMRTFRDRLHSLLTTRQPDMALRLASEAYARRLAEWLARESFDVVHIGGIEMAPYLGIIGNTTAQPRPLVVFDNLNCEYLLQRRAFLTDLRAPAHWPGALYSFVQWRRLRRYEAQVCRRADKVLAVSEADAVALQDLVPGLDVTVVPNGVDTQAYRAESPSAEVQIPQNALVFTGTMDFRPNVDAMLWFARRVLPLVRAQVSQARLFVVGQRPHRRLHKLRRDPAVVLTGWVEDVRPYIAQASVYVAPLRIGGGTRLKLLEAMAMGKAVVATRLGAEGYPVRDGHELVLADAPGDFAAAVVELLRAPERQAELGQAARAFVEQWYDWRAIVPRVEAVYQMKQPPVE